jgi:hypothetical protein
MSSGKVPDDGVMEKSRKKPIDKESLYKEIQKGVKHKPKSGWEEF